MPVGKVFEGGPGQILPMSAVQYCNQRFTAHVREDKKPAFGCRLEHQVYRLRFYLWLDTCVAASLCRPETLSRAERKVSLRWMSGAQVLRTVQRLIMFWWTELYVAGGGGTERARPFPSYLSIEGNFSSSVPSREVL